MKISKLFHWLYACLMLLPIFAVGITCAYAVFNKNAKDSYSHSEEFTYYEKVQYQTNEVNSVDDLVVGNVYMLDFDVTLTGTNVNNLLCKFENIDFISLGNFFDNFIDMSNGDILYRTSIASETSHIVLVQNINGVISFFGGYNGLVNHKIMLPFVYKQGSLIINNVRALTSEELTQYTYYIEKTTEVSTLDNVFYDSVREVGENPYFSWANDSFLAEPVQYITNLFGLPSDSSIITMLSYWLAISIIYLCFDVIMYIPLLAHRWLDKGILE